MSRAYPSQPVVGVGIVISKDDKVLLVKRLAEPGRDRWSIPGGIVDLGESLKKAARREALEETGLKVQVGDIVYVTEYLKKDGQGKMMFHFILTDFEARVREGEPKAASDAAEVKWVQISEAGEYALTNTTRELMEKMASKGLARV